MLSGRPGVGKPGLFVPGGVGMHEVQTIPVIDLAGRYEPVLVLGGQVG